MPTTPGWVQDPPIPPSPFPELAAGCCQTPSPLHPHTVLLSPLVTGRPGVPTPGCTSQGAGSLQHDPASIAHTQHPRAGIDTGARTGTWDRGPGRRGLGSLQPLQCNKVLSTGCVSVRAAGGCLQGSPAIRGGPLAGLDPGAGSGAGARPQAAEPLGMAMKGAAGATAQGWWSR